ncbi:NADH dehydrogenase [ubiquinone] 1 alpha subcomplex assembly factor 3 [Sarcoptes scabiei]|nr:NADH dehydrogenase [ubiquinone] 1 alpha subcomplex assembly factor 3 [Sarcoptes scabiei]
MSRKFISSLSGTTYNVHANEIARGHGNQKEKIVNSANNQNNTYLAVRLSNLSSLFIGRSLVQIPDTIKCVVHFLDDTEQIFEIDRSAKGKELLDAVFRHLELIENEYFSLQFTEIFQLQHHIRQEHRFLIDDVGFEASKITKNNELSQETIFDNETIKENQTSFQSLKNQYFHTDQKTIVHSKWIDPTKKIRKQMRYCQQPFTLYFRVKFYVNELSRLLEEYTRFHFYLQVRKDIQESKLSDLDDSTDSVMAKLASYVLQSELGDYCEDEHPSGYSEQFSLVPNQTKEFCQKVESLHRLHKGQTPADAELNYLEEAKNLPLYGVDLHHAKDCDDQDIMIGVSSNGLTIYKNKLIKMNVFSWAKIVKISFKRRHFFIQLKHEGTERFDNLIGFNLCSYRACKSLWKSCVEQHTFFRLHTPKPLTKKFFFFFSLGSKFRYSGKTEFQTIEENRKRLNRTERIFVRNKTRNATMPASLISTKNIKKPSNDALTHIMNLKLSNLDNNDCTDPHKTNGDFKKYPKKNLTNGDQYRKSPLNSIESTSESISSSSASSLLANTALTKSIIESDKIKIKVSSTVSHKKDKKFDSYQQRKLVETIFNGNKNKVQNGIDNQSSHHNCSKVLSNASTSTLSTTSSSSSTNSLETSFMPSNLDPDNTMTNNVSYNITPNTHADLIENNAYDKKNYSDHDFVDSKDDQSSAIIHKSVDINRPEVNGRETKVLLTSNNSTFSTAYKPSSLISLPYIDGSLSTVSDDKTNSLAQIETSLEDRDDRTPTLVETLENDCDNEKIIDKSSDEFNTPMRELMKELYDHREKKVEDCDINTPSDSDSPVHVLTISMIPDSDGRFGFNVKGGHDQNCPVLVSRVAPDTPADNATPIKLHEGDQVLAINGTEVAGLKHKEVVELIRSTKDLGPDSKLILSIRPNLYHKRNLQDNIEILNNDKVYQPSKASVNDYSGDEEEIYDEPPLPTLESSMMELFEGLQDDSITIQFEYLPRKSEKESFSIARSIENIPKNRYLDIAPYDSTRVLLKECNSGDYINASFVTMKIETSGVINRYIATQGPLKRTTSDFWQMVWEQQSTIIVMVTPLVEDGRKKCFKYWPDENQTIVVNDLLDLTLETCQDREAFLERKFKMIDPENKKTHYVTHLQYLAWPDQGVPDDNKDFFKLICKVRELRAENPESPVIVHCSAGIGRTGVLILMETGICLIEANEPVFPLDLVRQMRNQRAMLIQTSNQFRFVCEALFQVHNDNLVKPLEKYKN